tara:strand:+ start:333 stop:1118 length:786 start_codon:yes stop_codon:yes gene_type:complete
MTESTKLKYFIGRRCDEIDWVTTANIIWNMYGVCVFSVEEKWVRDLYTLPRSFQEISEDLGRWGTKHFGEIRTEVKVTDEDPLSSENMFADENIVLSPGTSGKTVVKLPEERIAAAIEFMKVSAKLVIEDQFDRKFLSLKARESKLEQFLWEAQVRESNNLDGDTPVIDSIVAAKGSKKEDVAAGILAGSAAFKEKVVALYADMLKVKQEFTNCATIKELNVLWQTYMGIPIPNEQAKELGQVHEEGEQLTQDDVDPGLHI